MASAKLKTESRGAVIDEFGTLDRQLAEIGKRHKQLKEQITGWLPEGHPDAEAYGIEGARYVVTIKAREFERTIVSTAAVIRAIGAARFREVATVTMKKLGELVDAAAFERLTTREQTGPRKLNVVKKLG